MMPYFEMPEGLVVFESLQSMLVPLVALLVPLIVVQIALRHLLSLKAFGTSHLTIAERNALASRYPAFRLFSGVVFVIALLFGALIVQIGFMQMLSLQHY